MRTAFSLFFSAALLTACAEDEATAPRARLNGAAPAASNHVQAVAVSGPVPSAKPVDQVGWTKAQTYISNTVDLQPGVSAPTIVLCPAGTTATGGGFEFAGGIPPTFTVPPLVWYSGPELDGRGWTVFATNFAGSGGVVRLRAVVRCAS